MNYEELERKAYIEGDVERAALYALLDDQQRELLEGTYDEGYDDGQAESSDEAYDKGYEAGYDDGQAESSDEAYDKGYEAGKSDAEWDTP